MPTRPPALDLRCLLDGAPYDLPALATALGDGIAVVHREPLSAEDGALYRCAVELPGTAADPTEVVRVELLAADGPLSHRLRRRLRRTSDAVIVLPRRTDWSGLADDLDPLPPITRPVVVTAAARPAHEHDADGVLDALRVAVRLCAERATACAGAAIKPEVPPSMERLRTELTAVPALAPVVVDTTAPRPDLPIGTANAGSGADPADGGERSGAQRRRGRSLGLRRGRRGTRP